VSPFFRDELLAPVLHFVSVDRGERGLGGKRSVPWEKQGGQPLSNIQHGFWQCNVVGLSCRSEWIILSTEVNLCLLGKRIASYKFCLGRTCISITIQFINEVVNGGVTIILFVVPNLVIRKQENGCALAKRTRKTRSVTLLTHNGFLLTYSVCSVRSRCLFCCC
jgi:hypothetical protein